MTCPILKAMHGIRRHPLAACCAALFAFTSDGAIAAAVTNCNDVGPGSLRAAVASAATGSTIDLSSLSCSTITLEDFEIVVPQHDLTIKGPRQGMTIAHDGAYSRVLDHQGTGTLKLTGLIITGGTAYSQTKQVVGGCIYSKGDVYLASSKVSYCSADTIKSVALGGGIYTIGTLTMVDSTLIGNVAGSSKSSAGYGGGAYAAGGFSAVNSTIQNNSARGYASSGEGGVAAFSALFLSESTVSGNSASFSGGLCGCATFPGQTISFIINSTISGNHASESIGGALIQGPLTMQNSTVAFNTAALGREFGYYYAPGLALANGQTFNANLVSSVLSNNTYQSNGTTIENDFSTTTFNSGASIAISGSDNLIHASLEAFPPNVVAVTACPLLGPLRNNGGLTKTHALLSHSPAVDRGSNPLSLLNDQRGTPFVRSSGTSATPTDIGAYEVQKDEIIFDAGFDGCP